LSLSKFRNYTVVSPRFSRVASPTYSFRWPCLLFELDFFGLRKLVPAFWVSTARTGACWLPCYPGIPFEGVFAPECRHKFFFLNDFPIFGENFFSPCSVLIFFFPLLAAFQSGPFPSSLVERYPPALFGWIAVLYRGRYFSSRISQPSPRQIVFLAYAWPSHFFAERRTYPLPFQVRALIFFGFFFPLFLRFLISTSPGIISARRSLLPCYYSWYSDSCKPAVS